MHGLATHDSAYRWPEAYTTPADTRWQRLIGSVFVEWEVIAHMGPETCGGRSEAVGELFALQVSSSWDALRCVLLRAWHGVHVFDSTLCCVTCMLQNVPEWFADRRAFCCSTTLCRC
jgi:hypothetical protein